MLVMHLLSGPAGSNEGGAIQVSAIRVPRKQATACHASRRDFGGRVDRQKARLMWLIEEMGTEKFKEKVASYMGVSHIPAAVPVCASACGQRQAIL